MIIKEKRWLSRFVAMLCVLTMVVGVLTPASVGVAAINTSVKKIKIKIETGIEYYDDKNSTAEDSMEYNAEVLESSDYQEAKDYKYNIVDDYFEIVPQENSAFKRSSLVFFAESSERPILKAMANEQEIQINIANTRNASGLWKITVPIDGIATAEEIIISQKMQYTVDFTNNSPGDCTIYDESGLSLTGSKKYDASSNIKFDVVLNNDAKNSKEIDVKYGKASQNPDSNEDGTYHYSINPLISNMSVIVTTKDKMLKIEPGQKSAQGYSASLNDTVKYGDSYKFFVNPEAGRTIKAVYAVEGKTENFDIKNPGDVMPLPEISTNYYEIVKVITDMKIYVDVSDRAQYNVLFNSATGYTIKKGDYEVTNDCVEHGSPCEFQVIPDTGYEILNVIATSSTGTQVLPKPVEQEAIPQKYTYTISSVTSDTTVTVNARKERYTIKYCEPSSTPKGYTLVKGETENVEYGTTYNFYITPKDGYKAPTVTASLTTGDSSNVPVVVNGNQYTINKITGNTTITIAEASKENRKITFNDKEGYYSFNEIKINGQVEKLSDLSSVPYGSKVEFKVELDPSCNQYKDSYSVKANGAKLTKQDEFYIIENITEDEIIEVTDVDKNIYTVTLESSSGYTLGTYQNNIVTHGSTFLFYWNVNIGYKNPTGIYIQGSDGSVTKECASTGTYSFTVTGNTKVSLQGVEEEKYTVTIKDTENDKASIKIVGQDSPIVGDKLPEIPYGGGYSFTVDADDYYQVEYVLYNGSAIEPAPNDVYTVGNIHNSNNVIEIKTRKNILTVNYSGAKYGKAVDNEDTTEGSIKVTYDQKNILNNLESSKPELCIYNFIGWTWNGNVKPKQLVSMTDDLKKLIEKSDAKIDIKALWKVNATVVTNGIHVETGAKYQASSGDKFKLTFECIVRLVQDYIGDEHKKDIKITGYGIIYSADEISSLSDTDIQKIKDRKTDALPPENNIYKDTLRVGAPMFNYFINSDLTIDKIGDGNSFRINSEVNKNVKRYGLAWMELTVGDEKIIIYDNQKELTTPSA